MVEPNAPDPAIMREELINTAMDTVPKLGRFQASQLIDAFLHRQMLYYAQMADSEVDTSSVEAAQIAGELVGVANAVIEQGAQYTEFMNEGQKHAWRFAAERLRDSCRKLVDLIR